MDFRVPDELAALRTSFAAFLDRVVRPIDERVRSEYASPSPDVEVVRSAAAEVKARATAEGFYAAHLPESVGGWGLSTLGMTLLVEDAAHSGMRLAVFAVAPPHPES